MPLKIISKSKEFLRMLESSTNLDNIQKNLIIENTVGMISHSKNTLQIAIAFV